MSGVVRGYYFALQQLKRPGARLVQQHSNNPSQHGYFIEPSNRRVSEDTARALIGGDKLRVVDDGLFPGHPQSWCISN